MDCAFTCKVYIKPSDTVGKSTKISHADKMLCARQKLDSNYDLTILQDRERRVQDNC